MSWHSMLPPGVADAFGLAAEAAAAPEPKKATPKKKRKRRRKRKAARSEELDVIATETGSHRDLRGQVGFLTVDYDETDRPFMATFDPFDERLKNAILPVHGWLQSAGRVHVTDDESVRWRFDVLDDPDEYDDDEEEDEDDE